MDLLTLQKSIPKAQANVPLAPFTSFRVGGPAEFFLDATSTEEAIAAITAANDLRIPYFILGGGTNLLVADEGVKGLVIRLANREVKIDGDSVTAGAGTPAGFLASQVAAAGLSGLEWMAGLPGTVGGAVRGNAGMFGGEVKDNLSKVRAYEYGHVREMTNDQCEFAYRHSYFKTHPGATILDATFSLERSEPMAVQSRLRENLERKVTYQPVDKNTAGCTFKNWKPGDITAEFPVLRQSLDLNKEEVIPLTPLKTVPAGWIIDRAQLKGMRIGNAVISDKHANFIIAEQGATASDVIALTAMIKMKVRDMTHGLVMLEDEIEYVGF